MSLLSKLFFVLEVIILLLWSQMIPSAGAEKERNHLLIDKRNLAFRTDDSKESSSILNSKENFTFLISGGMRLFNSSHLGRHIVSIRASKITRFYGDNHWCAGVIIAPNIILSVGHCTANLGGSNGIPLHRAIVVAGSKYRLRKPKTTRMAFIRKVKTHPHYNLEEFSNDIGIIQLSRPLVEDGKTIERIPLAVEPPKEGQKCTTFGWGRILLNGPAPNELLFIDIDIWPHAQCKRLIHVVDGIFCAGSKANIDVDACTGDSGGPLICDNKLVGLVSFGVACGYTGMPGFYTDVYYYRDWIQTGKSNRFKVNAKLFFISIVYMILFKYI